MMKEVDKQIKIIVVTGDEAETTAQHIEEKYNVTILTPHDFGEVYAESADSATTERDVDAANEAEHGTENFVLRVVEALPSETVAVLYDLSPADIDLLQMQYDSDFLRIEGALEETQISNFLAA